MARVIAPRLSTAEPPAPAVTPMALAVAVDASVRPDSVWALAVPAIPITCSVPADAAAELAALRMFIVGAPAAEKSRVSWPASARVVPVKPLVSASHESVPPAIAIVPAPLIELVNGVPP